MRQHKVGILGCGVISNTYIGDIRKFYKALDITACADVIPEAAKKQAERYGIREVCSVSEFLSDPEIEIVVNLTPPKFHAELNRQIIEAGKNLFCEKPFAKDRKTAEGVLKLAEEKGVKVACAPDTFLSSGLQSMRYYLDTGLIGKPFGATMNMTTFGVETWHPKPRAFYTEYSGPIYDMAPYYLSALVFLLGPVDSIAAFSGKGLKTRHIYTGRDAGSDFIPDVDTYYSAVLRLKSGLVANLNVTFDVYRSDLPRFEVFGEDGTLSYPDPNFGGGTPEVYRKEQYLSPVYQDTEKPRDRKKHFYELPELYLRVKDYSRGLGVLDLADAIEKDRQPRAGGDFLLHVTEVMEGIVRSARERRIIQATTCCIRPEPLKPGCAADEV